MKTAIIYNSYNNNENTDFFIRNGILENEKYFYYFIINDEYLKYDIDVKNHKQINRENIGRDFGAYSFFIRKYEEILFKEYDYFLFINQTVIGPMFPVWFRDKQNWPDIFTSMIDNDTKLSGISIGYFPTPHIQSTIFCTDKIGLRMLIDSKIFEERKSIKKEAIIRHQEVAMSELIINNGYNIKCLLKADQNIDFRKKPLPIHEDPWWKNYYLGKTPHPYETVFIKTNTEKWVDFQEIIGLYKTKIDLSNVSLVCIDTRAPELAIFAMQRCTAVANFKECLLLGSCPDNLPEGINHIDIGTINSNEDYSDFIIRRLGDYIQGDYVLIIQGDGFIIHPEFWTTDFFSVDYVGAPWSDRHETVGNGGFSLRSRRLLDALKNLNADTTHPEDDYICRLHRAELESQHGIVFAPIELAKKFSFEESGPVTPTFGFHGIYNIPKVLSEIDLKNYIKLYSGDILYSPTGRKIVKSLYKNGHYSDASHLLARRMKGPFAIRWDTLMLWVRSLLHQWWHRNADC